MPKKVKLATKAKRQTSFIHVISIALFCIIAIFLFLAYANVKKPALNQQEISAEQFLAKMTAHDEAKHLAAASPRQIVQINEQNLASLQSQIQGLDSTHLGMFIVEYADAIALYDYNNDQLRGVVQINQKEDGLPGDFLAKLNTHPELQGLSEEQPIGGILDQATLDTLKQQFPDIYANAQAGDYLLRYKTKLIIYNYEQDLIKTAVDLG